ncbi:MAG: phenylalanine--tRNA ligase subunit beta [Gemmatimonadetes bacterium]|nr:phenylalanine--tRNA ligase subunit beta [Gemmatimonadota bacterium]
MNVSVNWLSELLGTKIDPKEAAERLAMLGAPVESIEAVHQDLADIIVAEVERVEQHPNADRLFLCRVNNGSSVVEVVCGASNVTAGKKYPYAAVGSVLPGGTKLKGRKIRGIASNGMLCSPDELGLGTDHAGILELDTDADAGTPLLDVLPIGDFCLDVEVTPNRPDLLSHQGIARDLGAAMGLPVKLPKIPGAPADTRAPERVEQRGTVGGVEIAIEDEQGCPRFTAAVIKGVKMGPSPEWLQTRLQSVGQRPINNVVDATNYMMLELNQPMHAYDLHKLAGPALIARRGRANEKLVTLDGQEHTLDEEMTLICDADAPAGIGGVMGGRDSEVSEATTDVVLEAANFEAKRIRQTRTAAKMNTEASYRFERGMNLHGLPDALRRGVALIIAVAGGEEAGTPVDVYPKTIPTPTIFLRLDRVTRVLGVEIPQSEIEGYLTSLGFTVGPKDGRLAVHVPGWRPDVTREEDLIEEIARLRGYDSFEARLLPLRPSAVPDDPAQAIEARLRRIFTARGLHEARSSSLQAQSGEHAQAVLNPLSADEGFLRTELLSGLTRATERNWAVRERDVRLFEIGTVFRAAPAGQVPAEERWIAGVITGGRAPAHWSASEKAVDFDRWDVKSLFEEAIRGAGVAGSIEQVGDRWIARGGDGQMLGRAGELEANRPLWAGPLLGFELALHARPEPRVHFEPLPSTPAAERDIALVLPDGVTAAAVDAIIAERGGPLLESAVAFDEFRGEGVPGRSVAWRLVFRSPERTLRDKEVDGSVRKILTQLKEQLGVERRET